MSNYVDKLEPFLTTDDPVIQRTVSYALGDYPKIPREWTKRRLEQAIQSKEQETDILFNMKKAHFDEQAVRLIIEALNSVEMERKYYYLQLLEHVHPELLISFKEELSPFIQDEMWPFFTLLTEGSMEEVYEEFGQILSDLEANDWFDQNLFKKGKRLAQVIAEKGWVADWEIKHIIEENIHEDYFNFNGIYHVYMIGQLQKSEWIPKLAYMLTKDDDLLLEEAADTLVSFQSDEVVQAVAPYAERKDNIFPLGVIADTKSPLSVEVLIDLYSKLNDKDVLEIIIEGLCLQFSEQATPLIKQHLTTKALAGFADLNEVAYGFHKIMGIDHPKLEEWKRSANRKEAKMQEIMNKPIGQILAQGKKIGRNEPCPCGSGKKYKKCCGG